MNKYEIVKNIASRTNGDIYLGVVGPVRTGKSTFIKKVMEKLVIPNITDEYEKKRAIDELPVSSGGKTIMTTEPKFIPNKSQKVSIDELEINMRLIDCVGYIVENAKGYMNENDEMRLVKTPWYDDYISFKDAAEIGTRKVIQEHSSIGIVITNDGSICDLQREDYLEAEHQIISELKELNKPFVVVVNSSNPQRIETIKICEALEEKYDVPVLAINVDQLEESDIYQILREALYEFPVIEVKVKMPKWISNLENDHPVKSEYLDMIRKSVHEVDKLKDLTEITDLFKQSEYVQKAYVSDIDTSSGVVTIELYPTDELYSNVLDEFIGETITSRDQFMTMMSEYAIAKREYDQFKDALNLVKTTGYGIAAPQLSDLKLEQPEIIKHSGRYGVKLKSVAPSIHMIRVDVESVFEPIIGSEIQSQELINYLMKDYENNPLSIWDSEIFGRSLSTVVNEGIRTKLMMMPDEARFKLQDTLEKIVNNGSKGLIAILL